MVNVRKVLRVARFELSEARHSKKMALLALLYGGCAALGSIIFLSILRAAEVAARDTLSEKLQLDAAALPEDMIREQAMPWLIALVDDEGTREQLLQMDPLSIFFGFATLQSVAMLVLISATASIARDVKSGAVRFVLIRCDRLSWTVGKLLGQATLLFLGLLIAALVTAATGMWIDHAVDLSRLLWLLRTAFRSWLYGLSYLGLFMGVSMLAPTPMLAWAGAVLAWFSVGLSHAFLTAEWVNIRVPGTRALGWLFPPHHQSALWGSSWTAYAAAMCLLLGFGVLSFLAGYRVFESRDA